MTATQNSDDRTKADWDEIKRDARDAAQETAEEARDAGYAFVNSARDRAADYVERRKESAVQSIDDVAHTLRESSQGFDDRPNIRLFVDSAADGLENLADEIRERSFVEVYSDLEQFARRRPTPVRHRGGGSRASCSRASSRAPRRRSTSGAPTATRCATVATSAATPGPATRRAPIGPG